MIKAIVFDLDDTLFPEREYVYQGFEFVSKLIEAKYHVLNVKEKLIELFSVDINNVYNRLLDYFCIDYKAEFIKYLVNEYRSYIRTKLSVYDDVVNALENLKQKKYKIGLITDGRVTGQNNKIDALGIRKYFDNIIITDQLGIEFRKPHKKSFEFMANALKVNFHEMMYVGDNRSKDFAVAKELPITTVEIVRKDKLYFNNYLDEVKPKYIIESLNQLKLLL